MTSRLLLLFFAVFLSTICVALWATGGFAASLAGIRVSAHSPRTSGLGAALAAALWFAAAWRARSVEADLSTLEAWIERRAGAIIATVAALTAAIAVRFGTFSASGADPSGYLSEAVMLGSGALSRTEPLMAIADWPDAARTLAPLGWQAAGAAAQVPTYAVGLPLLMMLPHAVGGAIGASLVVCISAAVAVWFASRTALLFAGPAAGLLAAAGVATLPVQLFESMQPMSDVPVTAAWLACWWWLAKTGTGAGPVSETATGPAPNVETATGHTRNAVLAGVAAAIAVLIRPNLAPLAAVPAVWLLVRSRGLKVGPALWFAIPVGAAGIVVAYLQWRWFGSPLRSGYGSASEIYSVANIAPNVTSYFAWLLETGGTWLLAAALALMFGARALLRWMLAFAALVCFAYFIYGTFESWPYLRFLLPALAILAIATAVAAARVIGRLPLAARAPVAIALVLALAGFQIARARELGVFRVAARQSRAVLAGNYLASALSPSAVLISGEQSGAMRYYTRHSIVRWDFVDADAQPRVVARLVNAGHDVWIVLDDWEVALYREKFRSTPDGGLDWPPAVDAGTDGRIQAWRLRGRAPFVAGAKVITDRLR